MTESFDFSEIYIDPSQLSSNPSLKKNYVLKILIHFTMSLMQEPQDFYVPIQNGKILKMDHFVYQPKIIVRADRRSSYDSSIVYFFLKKLLDHMILSTQKAAFNIKQIGCYNQSNTMIKVVVLVLRLFYLSTALHFHHIAQINPEEHLLELFRHETTLSKTKDVHEVMRPVQGLTLLIDKYGSSFQKACKDGYKRSNIINVLNLCSYYLILEAKYIDRGKVLNEGNPYLKTSQSSQFIYTNALNTATSSSGVLVFALTSKTTPKEPVRIGLIFQNPWSAYNFAGVCAFHNTPVGAKNFYLYMYNRYGRPECAYFDNTKTKVDNMAGDTTLTFNSYSLAFGTKIKYANGCGIQEVNLVVGEA